MMTPDQRKNIKTIHRNVFHWIVVGFVVAGLALSQPMHAAPGELTDREITNAVQDELLYNTTTPSYRIDVSTSDGIVMLEGSVDNLLSRERAASIAASVKGVRGVVNKLDVHVPERSDVTLEKDVEEAILMDPAADKYEVAVNVNNGEVTLTGKVDSWQEKQLLAYVVKSVSGVKKLQNAVEVSYDVDRSDMEIRNEIESLLRNDVRVDDALLEVEVNDGYVELAGTVGSLLEKQQALTNAWVPGVFGVNADDLEVKDWAREEKYREGKYLVRSDEEIREAVRDVFRYDPRVSAFQPDVAVDNGTVRLTGIVDNLKAKRSAGEDARNVVGVSRVKNYLKVRPGEGITDKKLETRVEEAFVRDPFVRKYEVYVDASNGVVSLRGSVNNAFQRSQAEELASRQKGVVAVENYINVESPAEYTYYDYYGWNSVYPLVFPDDRDVFLSDREIMQEVNQQLRWSPFVNEEDIDVVVKNGTVILSGLVETPREKAFAGINAREAGAVNVENNIVVENNSNR